jgi:CDP-diacylglycerol--glycerol-3-phosphate 3-phosphatidyltransferase
MNFKKRDFFTIPNIMGYFRILLIPVYIFIYIHADSSKDYLLAALVIGISGLTDFFDGKIARKFDMITDLGKILDPVADKLTLGAIVLSLTFRYPFMREVLIIYIMKEMYMGIVGLLLTKYGWRTPGATRHGKVCTATLYLVTILLLLKPNIKLAIANVLMLVSIFVMIITWISYIDLYTRLLLDYKKNKTFKDVRIPGVNTKDKGAKKKRKSIMLLIPIFIVYLVAGALSVNMKQPEISKDYMESFSAEDFYSDHTGVDRARIVESNKEALDERIRMIAMAKERIILSTFEFRDDESGLDVLSALLNAAQRGVKVEVLVDGLTSWIDMEGNPYFYSLSSHPNATIILYNKVNLFTPWKSMGRMHDKYVIVDDIAYLLGGRNTFNYFLGDYGGHINYDRDVLVYNTAREGSSSSLYQLEAYFNHITALPYCSIFHGAASNANRISVKKATGKLEKRYLQIKSEKPELFDPEYDYTLVTDPTNKITLLSNPTTIYPKEPKVLYALTELMKNAKNNVKIHTPYFIPNDIMYQLFQEIARNSDVTIMFNSVANNGNPFAASDYYYNRKQIIDIGMKILEYDGGVSYHGKSIAIDDDIAIIGSFNLDPRSTYLSTELMLVINGEDTNRQLVQNMCDYEKDSLEVNRDGSYSLQEDQNARELTGKKYIRVKLFHLLFGWARNFF